MRRFARDLGSLYLFGLHEIRGNPAWVALGLFQPIVWLLLFGPLVDQLAGPGLPAGGSFQVYVPGLLVMVVLFGSLFLGLNLISQVKAGALERLAATPVARLALLLGPVLRDVTLLLCQAVLLLGIAVLMGLRPNPGGTVLALVLLALTGATTATVSYGMALRLRDENTLATATNLVSLPLVLLSGLLLPLSLAPGWLQAIAWANPLSYAVEACRQLMAGSPDVVPVVRGFAVVIALGVAVTAWTVPKFRRVSA